MRSFNLFLTATLVGGVIAGSAVVGATASAVALTPTKVTGFTVSPTTISYSDTQVTVSGQLVEASDPSVGIPGQPVAVEYAPPGDKESPITTVSTGSGGDFTALVSLPAGGSIMAVYSGSMTYESSRSNAVSIYTDPEYPVVTLNPQAKTLVPAGTSLTFTGKAQVDVGGAPEPLAGAPVFLFHNGAEAGGLVTTKADGTFTLAGTATSGGVWQAEVEPVYSSNQSLYAASASNEVTVAVAHNTRVQSFSVPAKREAHSAFTVSGIAQQWSGTKWTGASYVLVSVYYRDGSSTVWRKAGSGQANSGGAFKINPSVVPGHTVWQVRVPAQGKADVYHASVSGTRDSFVTDETCFSGLAASHVNGRTQVQGFVIDHCGNRKSFGTVKGTAKVYYHPRGTTAWRYLGSVRTGAGGSVVYTYYKTLAGYFRIVFPAQGYYLGSTSKTMHLG